MTAPETKTPFVAIACGGTGGHLFPGLAVAEELKKRGCTVALLISPKDVDQQAVKSAQGFEIFTLPAVGLQNRNYFSFAKSFWNSFRASRKIFKQRKPDAVLAMGGFTSAPPILAARKFGAKTFLHESNTIPGTRQPFSRALRGRGVRRISRSRRAIEARKNFRDRHARSPAISASKIRRETASPIECRVALGLDPNLPTILVIGGSQGASGLNEMILSALPLLAGEKLAMAASDRRERF